MLQCSFNSFLKVLFDLVMFSRKTISYLDWKSRVSQQSKILDQWIPRNVSVLDVGCGGNSPVALLGCKYLYGVDGFLGSVVACRSTDSYLEVYHDELLNFVRTKPASSFDVVVALDVIEHFIKPLSEELVFHLKRIAAHRVVLATPNGFLPQAPTDNPFQEHKCGWSVRDLRTQGFSCQGLYGCKVFRDGGHELLYPNSSLLAYISKITFRLSALPCLCAGLIAKWDR